MQWLTSLFGWLAGPFLALTPARRRFLLLLILNVLILIVGLVGLWAVNNYTGLANVLRTRWMGLHRFWLPLCFLAAYVLFWVFWWLWRLLGPEGRAGEFDDIEAAWAAARGKLDEAGISLTDVPVYLVLGRPAGGLESFFAASRQPMQVRQAPAAGAPLHVWANREVVFVGCEGASLLAVQARRLEEVHAPPALPAPVEMLAPVGAEGEPIEEPAQPAAAPAAELAPRPGVLLLGEPEPRPGEPVPQRRAPLVRDEEAVALQGKRLRHVCRLLARDRRPYCPVNGILLLVPLAATDNANDASETGEAARRDIHVARESLQLDCPVIAVLCDAERLPGFVELARHFPETTGGPTRVLGQHFPVLPDLPAEQIPGLIEGGMGWVANDLLPLVVGRLWRREGEEGVLDRTSAIRSNLRLYGLLAEGRERLPRFGRLAARATTRDEGPPLLAGCYLAGTGPDEREQAFLPGVLRKLLEHQNDVAWSPQALAEDAAYRWYAGAGYVLLLALIAGVVTLLVLWW